MTPVLVGCSIWSLNPFYPKKAPSFLGPLCPFYARQPNEPAKLPYRPPTCGPRQQGYYNNKLKKIGEEPDLFYFMVPAV